MIHREVGDRQAKSLYLAGNVTSAGTAVAKDEIPPTLNVAYCLVQSHDIRADLV